jgi:hypothetical protein
VKFPVWNAGLTTPLSSRGGTSELSVTKSLPAPAVCCSGWFGVPRYQNRHHGFLAAASSRAPELPGLLPADARYYRSRWAMQFGIGGSSG